MGRAKKATGRAAIGETDEDLSVSCVVPCFNCAETLVRCVRSVQGQTSPVHEIILVDDCSRDETPKIIEALAEEDPRIVNLRLPSNSGPACARNLGWARADGAFIAFIDADDSWHPQKIEIQLRLFRLCPELAVVGHLAVVPGESGASIPQELSDSELAARAQPISRAAILMRNPWSTPTAMLRSDITLRFDEDQREAEDYLLFAQILLSGAPGMRINLPLAKLYKARYGAGGLSGNLWKMEKGELLSIRKLWRRGHIGVAEFVLVSLLSLAKYCRRVLVTR